MRSFYCLLIVFFSLLIQSSYASYPMVEEEEPHVAVAPVHVAPAPVVVRQPVIAAQPVVSVPVPQPIVPVHHHPRTELRNVVSHYAKETGHTSATDIVSGDHHAFDGMHFPNGNFIGDHFGHDGPWKKARLHRQKLASKKTLRKQKSLVKKRN
ncbi:hypothetical protein RB195_008525 [Necator americanus]|uniref:Uncharacterized protein n=1 Tax=Necator americanus TaxID=51031 RepID=A0ABR1CPW9_NECAM